MPRTVGSRHRKAEFGLATEQLRNAIIALALIALAAPLFTFIALAIRSETAGPIFRREQRLTRDGRPYSRLRFRTTARSLDRERVTPVGQFLLLTRLDGLPQLLNVLRGEIAMRDLDLLA